MDLDLAQVRAFVAVVDHGHFGRAAAAALVAPVVATWPIADDRVRVVPLRPTPRYPWHAVWRTAGRHPALGRVLRALRAAAPAPDPGEQSWLPRGAAAAERDLRR